MSNPVAPNLLDGVEDGRLDLSVVTKLGRQELSPHRRAVSPDNEAIAAKPKADAQPIPTLLKLAFQLSATGQRTCLSDYSHRAILQRKEGPPKQPLP
jgi:hypothetical protein